MLSSLSRFARLGIISGLAAVFVAAPALRASAVAWADDDDDDDASGDDDDDGGGGGGDDDDSAGGGGDDDDGGGGGDDDDDDDEEEADKDQPAVTAGGLFTKKTYPIAELERPLTLTGGIAEVRGGIDIDMSNEGAFETWNVKLDGRYGMQDNVELQFAFAQRLLTAEPDETTGALSFAAARPKTSAEVGLEFAIAYDLVDFRTLLVVPAFGDEDTEHGIKHDFDLGLAFGFPFRYKPKENVAVVALEKLMTIHLVPQDKQVMQMDGTFKTESSVPKPDLTIGVGIVFQALPPLALILRGELIIPEFNFKDNRRVPATLAVQFTPARNVDIGGEFTLGNVAPVKPEGATEDPSPFDDRSLLLFGQFRL
jgi:hypothetical protein